ncbi:stage III sporulation protein AF [Effusibacillus consociatus]|uniref:Stage III sporulation protein AF n=1 Tax=Effusibacillus consociatus TaxID=1117041 RepID=A0ABV9Q4S4_9BACL
MALLSSWLLQIVLILLFAVVMDLVIPTNAMRNYVRVVMGLVIMVTMLKPISALYDNKFDLSRIQWPEAGAQFAGFDSIKSKAEKLQRDQMRQAQEQLHIQLEKLVKEQVESAYPLEVTQVQARFADPLNESHPSPEITELSLQVRPKENNRSGSEIQPVQPVNIQLDKQQEPGKPQADSIDQEKISKQIKQDLASRFQISGSAVSIKWMAD